MKIKFQFVWALLLAFFCASTLQAQLTVVKQDGSKIYLDTSDYNRTISVGDSFKIILSQEKLINPKTGKDLGMINHYSQTGKIIEVQPLYAVGEIAAGEKYTPGQQAVLEAAAAPVPTALPANASAEEESVPVFRRKQQTYNVLEHEIIGAVKADLTPFPGEEIAVADTKGNLILYSADGNSLQEKDAYKLPVGQKPLALSAFDLMNLGYSQLFLTVYQEKTQRIFTLVFDVQNQKFLLKDTLPYFVQELGCAEKKTIYAQKPFISGIRPGDVHPLKYKDGHFALDKDAFKSYGKWLAGINKYAIQNADTENFIYTASNGTLRLRLKNGKYVDSPSMFASTPNRIKYKQQVISFYPALQAYGPKGNATLAGIQNTSKLGLLSEQFGQYNGGKLHFLNYQNGTLKITETVLLDGFVYNTTCTAHGILVPQVLSSGQTVLTEIYR